MILQIERIGAINDPLIVDDWSYEVPLWSVDVLCE